MNMNCDTILHVEWESLIEKSLVINIEGGQVTKPIIIVKIPCKLLHVIQVKGFLINTLSLKILSHKWSTQLFIS